MAQITATRQDIDIDVKRDANGVYDIAIDDQGDLATTNSLDTAIEISWYCEVRADESEEQANELRRGWWGNTLSDVADFQVGSKMWLLSQARNTQDTLNRAIDFSREAFQWMIDDNIAQDVIVNGSQSNSNIGLEIQFIRSNNNVDTKFFELWNNTGTFD